ncbi:hypothetical protein GCM10007380_34200 [Gottfriedia solisilvae]|uniref:Uncharacterized protein n=1 Tax=Gottfriedia solisilvae TaxID=1516104 RepID=A0A8J3F4F5_9BACI|nr:hypothetical protein GCM10007380_34200 [Gottfriedia solisilvae]
MILLDLFNLFKNSKTFKVQNKKAEIAHDETKVEDVVASPIFIHNKIQRRERNLTIFLLSFPNINSPINGKGATK